MTPHRRIGAALAVAAVVVTAPAATAQAVPEAPRFTDGHGLTVVEQPAWLDGGHRSFSFAVRTAQVPTPTLLTGQKPGQHTVVVTLPEDYDPSGATRHPVLYSLHGHQDVPDSEVNRRIVERSTAGTPLITVQPNGGGRGWYSNWVNPGAVGPQNWESFHLDQLIPFVDANLRTIAAREGRAIAGHSMGGFGAFHYAEHRPELFSHLGSFSGGLDLLDQTVRTAVVTSALLPASGLPTVGADAIFGPPVWPLDGVWNAQSPAQHVAALRGMGVAMYVGDGGNLLDNPVQAVVENRARQTNLVTSANLRAAGIEHVFVDYGDGSGWAPGCTGKHAQPPCLQADLDHFVGLLGARLRQS